MDVESRPGIFAPTQTDTQYLHQSGAAIYAADKRRKNDLCFTVSYVLLAALTLFWGIACFVYKDPNAGLYTVGFFVQSSSCNLQQYRAVHAGDYSIFGLLPGGGKVGLIVMDPQANTTMPTSASVSGRTDDDDDDGDDDNGRTTGGDYDSTTPPTDYAGRLSGGSAFANGMTTDDDYSGGLTDVATFSVYFKEAVAIWLPISAAFALGFSIVYLILFRKFAKAMVMLAIGFSLAFTFVLGIFTFAGGAPFMGVILVILGVLFAVFYWCIRRKLQLCADLLALSARSLFENVTLMPSAIAIKLAGLGVLAYCFAAMIHAAELGQPKANSATVKRDTFDAEEVACFNSQGDLVPCCVYETPRWAVAYNFFCAVFICWTAMLILEIKLFVVADTVAQWYFSAPAPGAAASVGVSGHAQSTLTRGSVRLAMRHCFVDSFGSVAFAAAIIALINFIRTVLRRAARRNIFCCIINLIAQPILALMEKFTRFATIATAITGQAFVPAAKTMFETLQRNFLQTYTMWWVPDFVLRSWVFLLSLSWSAIVLGSTYGLTVNKGGTTEWGVPVTTAILSFLLVWFILGFMAGMLLDASNSLYICYALDKDNRRVSHPEVHSMFAQIPGLAVENPDGNIMYGAPDTAHQQRQQVQLIVVQMPPQQTQGQPVPGVVCVPPGFGYTVQQPFSAVPIEQHQETTPLLLQQPDIARGPSAQQQPTTAPGAKAVDMI